MATILHRIKASLIPNLLTEDTDDFYAKVISERTLNIDNEYFCDTPEDWVKKYHFPTNGLNYAETHIQEKHVLRPIPQDQIDKCSNEYPQNPGY
jgi:hypothetical protein